MKERLITACIGFFLLGFAGSLMAKELPKIGVWDLEPRNIPASYAKELTSILVSEISKLDQYEVYSQENIRALAGWTEERMKLGCTSTQCLTALGQMDIAKLISGSVGKIGNTYSISLNLFDTQNAKAEKAISEFCRSEDELIPLVQQAVRNILRAGIEPSIPEGERKRREAEEKRRLETLRKQEEEEKRREEEKRLEAERAKAAALRRQIEEEQRLEAKRRQEEEERKRKEEEEKRKLEVEQKAPEKAKSETISTDLGKSFNVPFKGILNIVTPDANLPKEITSFSGVWEGIWGDMLLPSQLVVEQIDLKQAIVVYGWADHPQGRFKGGWSRQTAKVIPPRTIEWGGGDRPKFSFTMDKNLNNISGKRVFQNEISYIDMLKTEKPSQTIKELRAKQVEEKRLANISGENKRIFDELRAGRGPFLIDDFESKDLWSVNFNDRWRELFFGNASGNVSADATQGANGTSCSMKIEYKLLVINSEASVWIGGYKAERISEVENDRSTAYDLSRFKKIAFYLKGAKSKTFFLRPNNILVYIFCYGEDIKSRYGKAAGYYNKTRIYPDKEWKKIEIPFDDLVPSAWTRYSVSNYPQKPDLHNCLNLGFVFSSYEADGGFPDSNTVWIDEITLE